VIPNHLWVQAGGASDYATSTNSPAAGSISYLSWKVWPLLLSVRRYRACSWAATPCSAPRCPSASRNRSLFRQARACVVASGKGGADCPDDRPERPGHTWRPAR
jgi:hypothetical protein